MVDAQDFLGQMMGVGTKIIQKKIVQHIKTFNVLSPTLAYNKRVEFRPIIFGEGLILSYFCWILLNFLFGKRSAFRVSNFAPIHPFYATLPQNKIILSYITLKVLPSPIQLRFFEISVDFFKK
jgi:hypothetical protein